MKRITILTVLLCVLTLIFTATVCADSEGPVNYVLGLSCTQPATDDAYEIGETVKITVSTKDIAGGVSPLIYGFNGAVNYDSYLLELKNVRFLSGFGTAKYLDDKLSGKLSFAFLCGVSNGDLAGVTVGSEFNIVELTFTVKKNGKAKITLSDFIFTDKEANERYISSWDATVDMILGDGVEVADKESIKADIAALKAEAAKAVIDGNPENLTKEAFAVSQGVYDAFMAEIRRIENELVNSLTEKQILELSKQLNNAYGLFCDGKIYGRRSDFADALGTILSNYVEVSAIAGEGGYIDAGYASQQAYRGTSVTIRFTANDGYEVDYVTVNGMKHSFSNGYVTIPSVNYDTVVRVFFVKAPTFKDVPRSAWYYEAVEAIVAMDLFRGTGDNNFTPDGSMTRAMLVTVLHRLEGTPKSDFEVLFKDVDKNMWYTEAVAWAAEKGIVDGYDKYTFGTNDSITRQDIVTVLYRYAKYKGVSVKADGNTDAFVDIGNVADYAKDAMKWAIGAGIIKGTTDTTLAPRDSSTRAQVATVILRYTQNIK